MSPQPETRARPASDSLARRRDSSGFTREERDLLLHLARESIQATLEGRPLRLPEIPDHLKHPRGAFTTIYLDGAVRGCVGYLQPLSPLDQTVIETASAAAFHDGRFLPLNRDEAARIRLSLSILSPVLPIRPADIELGKHGVVVSMGNRRALLLPQVPIEQKWDVATFLEQTCRKAGLRPDAWQHGASLEAFTAEVFGDSAETC
jgi:AmmeMemoRadiSam system protein A